MRTRIWAVGSLLVLGCGEAKPPPAATGGMTVAGSGGAASGGSGGPAGGSGANGGSSATNGGGGGGGQGGGDASDKITGTFTIQSSLFNSVPNMSINAVFPAVDPTPGTSTCTRTTHGACTLARCAPASGEPAPAAARHHVGPVTLESEEAEVRVVAQPNELGAYLETEDAGQVFSGGEAFTFTAAGGTLPGFTYSAVSPLLLLIDAPLPEPAGPAITVAVPRTEPFTFTWTRGVANVSMYVQSFGAAADANGGSVSFSCLVDSTLGTATLDAELVAAMPVGAEARLFTIGTGQVESDTSLVRVALASEAINPEKTAMVQLRFE